MKCYYCGKNEAEYRFLLNYMGNIGDIRLCSECFGTLSRMAAPILSELRERLHERTQFTDELRGLLNQGEEGNVVEKSPKSVDFLRWINDELSGSSSKTQEQESAEAFVPPDEENTFKRRRRLNALRERMSLAIGIEDYEAAACLRDEIGRLEKDGAEISAPKP